MMTVMSLVDDHPRIRWAAPAAAVLLVGTATFAATRASADPSLPPRTAEQLLTDLAKADVQGMSGTVVQSADLGLPQLPGLDAGIGGGSGGSGGSSNLSSMVSGTHTLRVWYGGPQQVRLALVGSNGESDVIRNGSDLWVWSSTDKTAVHRTLRKDAASSNEAPSPGSLPATPEGAAKMALAMLDPTTKVTTAGTAEVAGRPAYELVLTPKSGTTLVSQVRIAVDATENIPLRVQVYSTKISNPAIEVGFSQITFGQPEARQFTFTPPPGTTVTQGSTTPGRHSGSTATTPAKPSVVGTGWDSVVVATIPQQAQAPSTGAGSTAGIETLLKSLPKVSGSWGSGHLLSGTLFSAVLTDSGKIAVGAVPPNRLYAALTSS